MSLFPAILSLLHRSNSALPRWQGQRLSPRVRDEGDPVKFQFRCTNAKVGSRIVFWMTGGGNLGSNSNWLYRWIDLLRPACEAVGIDVLALTANTVPTQEGTISFLFTVTQKYVDYGPNGAWVIIENFIRRDRKNNAANLGDIRGGAGSFQMLFKAVTVPALTAPDTPANTYGTVASAVGVTDVRDTSRRPAGVPTFKITSFDPVTGGTALTNLFEDDSFKVRLETTNMIPGTAIKIYAANLAQKDVEPDWRTGLKRAALAAGCECYVPPYDPANPKLWFNGGLVTFTAQYDEKKPIEVLLTVKDRKEPLGDKQFDIVSTVQKEGDAIDFETVTNKGDYDANVAYIRGDYVRVIETGRVFLSVGNTKGNSPPTDEAAFENTWWREYIQTAGNGANITKIFKDRPPKYWQIRAEKTGSQVRYEITPPTKVPLPNIIKLRSTNEPAGFKSALGSVLRLITGATYKVYKFVNDNEGDLGVYSFPASYIRVKMGTGKYKANGPILVDNPYYDPTYPEGYDNPRQVERMSFIEAPMEECDFADNTTPYFFVTINGTGTHARTLDNEFVPVSDAVVSQWQRLNRSSGSLAHDYFPKVNGSYVATDMREGGGNGHKIISQSPDETLYEIYIGDATGRSFGLDLSDQDTGKHVLKLEDPQATHYISIRWSCVFMTDVGLPNDPANVYGVNMAGGEFGDTFVAGKYAPYRNDGYRYPAKPESSVPAHRHLMMDYHWREGSRICRLPVKWERIQPELFGPLYYGPDEPFTVNNRLDMRRVDDCVDYWTKTLGGILLLDVHNYMKYAIEQLYNEEAKKWESRSEYVKWESASVTPDALINLWVQLANKYADNEKVWFGIMNEPSGGQNSGQTPVRVAATMQNVVNAIRALTPARNKIAVAGAYYSGAKRWVTEGNAAAFDDFIDPLGNVLYEPHNYINPDQSGAGTKAMVCVVQTATNNQMLDFCNWLRAKPGRKGLVGEFAAGNPNMAGAEECPKSAAATYKLLHDTYSDVIIGYTAWATNFGKTYPFALDPPDETFSTLPLPTAVSPCLAMLKPWLAGSIP